MATVRQRWPAYAEVVQPVRKPRKRVRKLAAETTKTGAIAPVSLATDRFPDRVE
jgi:hypothetical protein